MQVSELKGRDDIKNSVNELLEFKVSSYFLNSFGAVKIYVSALALIGFFSAGAVLGLSLIIGCSTYLATDSAKDVLISLVSLGAVLLLSSVLFFYLALRKQTWAGLLQPKR